MHFSHILRGWGGWIDGIYLALNLLPPCMKNERKFCTHCTVWATFRVLGSSKRLSRVKCNADYEGNTRFSTARRCPKVADLNKFNKSGAWDKMLAISNWWAPTTKSTRTNIYHVILSSPLVSEYCSHFRILENTLLTHNISSYQRHI